MTFRRSSFEIVGRLLTIYKQCLPFLFERKMPHPSFFADVASVILEVIKFIKSVYLMITFWSSFEVLCCPIHYKP